MTEDKPICNIICHYFDENQTPENEYREVRQCQKDHYVLVHKTLEQPDDNLFYPAIYTLHLYFMPYQPKDGICHHWNVNPKKRERNARS